MVVGLLGLVLVNGFSVFWAPQVPTVKLADGTTHIGQLAQRRIRPGSPASDLRYERQYQVGLKEVNGGSYVWVDEKKVAQESFDPSVLGLERIENGPAFVVPVAFIDAKGVRVEAGNPRFYAALQAEVEHAAEIREEMADINRRQIGEVNAEMESLRIDQRRAEDRHAPTQAVVDRLAKLDARFAELKASADKVAAGISAAKLEARDAAGRALSLPAASLVRAWEPNRMTFWDRVGLLFSRLREFLFDEPREANTEGGLMPAIFGTLVMTVFMSLLVTPFGVIAAIYLREYAKDGPILRAVRICVNNLAGVPSIVFGVFGLAFFVYFVGAGIDQTFYSEKLPTPTFGTPGILWASLTLALLTLPVVIVATEEALSAVPRGVREAALACGASKWQTIQRIVLPASLPGILTGVILAMARGAGEVAPLMIVGVVKYAPTLPIDGIAPFIHAERKFMHLGFHIYDLGFQSPDAEAAKPFVYATALLLILVVVSLNLTAILIRNRLKKRFAVSSF
jgi:phosphate transport system permease protein